MTVIDIKDAEILALLIEKARGGEEVVLERDGVALARMVPVRAERVPGRLKGLIHTGDEAAEPLDEEELRHWE